jgi:hypothetical protein
MKRKFRNLDKTGDGDATWAWQDLQDTILAMLTSQAVLKNMPKLIVLLEALDQSNQDAAKGVEGSQILQLLRDFAQTKKRPDDFPVKFMIVSRHATWIEEKQKHFQRIDLELMNEDDIRWIVSAGVSDLRDRMPDTPTAFSCA